MFSINNTEKLNKSKVFFDWQLRVIESLEATGEEPIGSRQVWEEVNQTTTISRASVINFLKRLFDLDLIAGHLHKGKGGKRYHYTLPQGRDHFNAKVVGLLMTHLVEEYGDSVDLFKILRLVSPGQ